MTDHPMQPADPTRGLRISDASVQYMTDLLERLQDERAGAEDAVERAFHDAVRAAWVSQETWAVEYVAASQEAEAGEDGRTPSLLGVLEDLVQMQLHTGPAAERRRPGPSGADTRSSPNRAWPV